jgi:hypothetical protein
VGRGRREKKAVESREWKRVEFRGRSRRRDKEKVGIVEVYLVLFAI